MMANNTKVFKVVDFPRRLSRSGVSPDIERLTLAGETPALHSESPKPSCFWYNRPGRPFYTLVAQAVRRSAAVTQFDISIAIVMGPTPPGTGVIAAQRSATAS